MKPPNHSRSAQRDTEEKSRSTGVVLRYSRVGCYGWIQADDGGPDAFGKPRTCDVVGCGDHVAAKNLCAKHYIQARKGWPLRRHGETLLRRGEGVDREPWEYRNDAGEAELAAMYGEGSNANAN